MLFPFLGFFRLPFLAPFFFLGIIPTARSFGAEEFSGLVRACFCFFGDLVRGLLWGDVTYRVDLPFFFFFFFFSPSPIVPTAMRCFAYSFVQLTNGWNMQCGERRLGVEHPRTGGRSGIA